MSDIQIITLPAFILTGLSLTTTPMSPAIMQLWGSFVADMPRIQGRTEPHTTYGGMGPLSAQSNTFEYFAGVAVSADTLPLAGHQLWHVPASTYAICPASIATIGQIMDHIHQWLRTSTYTHGDAPSFERYGPTFMGGIHDPIDILVSVKPRA